MTWGKAEIRVGRCHVRYMRLLADFGLCHRYLRLSAERCRADFHWAWNLENPISSKNLSTHFLSYMSLKASNQPMSPLSTLYIHLSRKGPDSINPGRLLSPLLGFVQKLRQPGVVFSRQETRSYLNLLIKPEVLSASLWLYSALINRTCSISCCRSCVHSVWLTSKDEEGWVERGQHRYGLDDSRWP